MGKELRLVNCVWDYSGRGYLYALDLSDEGIELSKAEKCVDDLKEPVEIIGYYARYLEGIFSFFRLPTGAYMMGWRNQFVDMACVGRMEHRVAMTGIYLELFDHDDVLLLSMRYQSFWRLIVNPLKIIDYFLDIGDVSYHDYVLCDQPDTVKGWFDNGQSFNTFKSLVDSEEASWRGL